MMILPIPMLFGQSTPTTRRYSLVCKTADGRPIYIQLYGKHGLGQQAFVAAKSVLRPSVEPEWDMEDEREPIGWCFAWSILGVMSLGVAGAIAVIVADIAGFLPSNYFEFGGWAAIWTRICLGVWPFVLAGILIRRWLNRPGP